MGNYANGKEEGFFQNWNEAGELTEAATWHNGIKEPENENLQPKGKP
jgi:antitoxin component YwqK of YwqJK toxin-antitoxin module